LVGDPLLLLVARVDAVMVDRLSESYSEVSSESDSSSSSSSESDSSSPLDSSSSLDSSS